MMTNPTTLAASFNESLALTDSSGSGTWTAVAPTRYSDLGAQDGLWLEEAGTNYAVNPRFAVDLTSASAFIGTETVTRDTSDFYISPASCRVECDSTNEGVVLTSANGVGGVGVSVVGWMIAKIPLGATIVTYLQITYDDASVENGTPENHVGTGEYAFYDVARTSDGAKTIDVVKLIPITPDATPVTYRVGFWQIEKSDYATSYTDGSLGDGYAWTGTPHASTSTRAASSASIDPTDRIDPASGAIAFRYKRLIDTGSEEVILTCGSVGSGTDYLEIGIDASDKLYMEWNSDNAGAERVTSTDSNIAVDTEYLIYADWDGTTIRVSVDNGALDSDTRAAAEGDLTGGDLTISAATGSHVVGPFAVFDRVLVANEITQIYNETPWRFDMLTGTSPYILTPRMNVRNNTLLRR